MATRRAWNHLVVVVPVVGVADDALSGLTRHVTARQSHVSTSPSPQTAVQLGRQGETDVGAHPGHDTRTLHGVSGNVTHNDDDDSPTGPSGMSTDHELQPLHVTNGAPPAIATWDDAAHNPSSLYTQTVGSPPSRKQETTTDRNVSQHAYLSLSLSLCLRTRW